MTAVITDDLKLNILRNLLADYNAVGTNYYIGLARSEYWDSNDVATTPINSQYDQVDFKNRMQSIKKVEAASLVVPRSDWVKGTVYPQWDDQRAGSLSLNKRYYVLTDNHGVFVCLRTGKNKQGVAQPSLVKPAFSNNDPFPLSDGYVWKFLYTISAIKANYFLSSQYMPVHRQDLAPDSNSTGIQIKQWEIQNAADPGRITSFIMTDGGAGYGTAGQFPSITIRGDGELVYGDSASLVLTPVIDSDTGTITAIKTDATYSNTLNYLDSYSFAEVIIAGGGGSGAKARAVIGPSPGFGYDAPADLKATAVMFRSKILETDTDFFINQDFRQIGLIKNPTAGDSTGMFSAITGIAANYMKIATTTTAFSADKTIEGVSSGAKGYIDNIDSDATAGPRVFYHQSAETGFQQFQVGETIQEIDGSGEGTIGDNAKVAGEVNKSSGDILYLDNRSAVQRIENQSEDIKVIIQL